MNAVTIETSYQAVQNHLVTNIQNSLHVFLIYKCKQPHTIFLITHLLVNL